MSEFINQPLNIGSGIAETTSIEVPPEKDVVFYNDDYTTMEFVVDVLVSNFNFFCFFSFGSLIVIMIRKAIIIIGIF